MSKLDLHALKPRHGARKKKLRVGRGEGSGHGKTAGRGGKGQKGRKGATIRAGFEGGQMPLYRRVPKLGFFSRKKVRGVNVFSIVKLSALNVFDNGSSITSKELAEAGLVKCGDRVKILAAGELSKKLNIKVDAISAAAKSKIEASGGTVEILVQKQS